MMSFSKLRMWLAVTALVTSVVTTASAQTFRMTTPIAPGVATPNRLDTSIGTLNLSDGFPAPDTIERIYANLDRSRALQAYTVARPISPNGDMRARMSNLRPDNETSVS